MYDSERADIQMRNVNEMTSEKQFPACVYDFYRFSTSADAWSLILLDLLKLEASTPDSVFLFALPPLGFVGDPSVFLLLPTSTLFADPSSISSRLDTTFNCVLSSSESGALPGLSTTIAFMLASRAARISVARV